MTIIESIKEVMRAKRSAMTVQEIYDAIIAADLYTFHADNPQHIVSTQLGRHCLGLEFPSASQTNHFKIVDDSRYYFLDSPVKVVKGGNGKALSMPDRLLADLKSMHQQYQEELKKRILQEIRAIKPANFEISAVGCCTHMAFTDLIVTCLSRDGGVDGHGRLRVGLAYLNVAFQCKRWNKNPVGRPEIDKFRGAIQAQFEQGLLFTTGSFASGAEAASFQPGAVPIILIDDPAIVELMIEKQFGV